MYMVTKVHPNVIATKTGPAVTVGGRREPQPIHLRQGEMDGACGPHCVLMALMALRVVRRGWVTDSPANAPRSVKAALRLTSEWYFCGTAVRDLAQIVQPLDRLVTASASKASHAALIPFILANLAEERLVVVGVHNSARRLKHWTLALGVAGVEKRANFTPSTFCCSIQATPPSRCSSGIPRSRWRRCGQGAGRDCGESAMESRRW
jgi:hypothetical protein